MNYKNILLIGGLVLALGFLAFSVGFFILRRGEVTVVSEPTATTQPTTTTELEPVTYTEEWKDAFGKARTAMDPEKCNTISDTAARQDCQDKINLLLAYKKQDINACRAIFEADLRDSCYVNLGSALGIDYCLYVTTEEMKRACEEAAVQE